MIADDDEAAPVENGHRADDRSRRLTRDLATSPPPKGLDTVTAAADAADKADSQGAGYARRHRIRTRAYELWEQGGRPDDRQPADFWLQAETAIDREGGED